MADLADIMSCHVSCHACVRGLMGDAKLREVLQRHGTRYAMVLRDNELDRILCMARRPRVDKR